MFNMKIIILVLLFSISLLGNDKLKQNSKLCEEGSLISCIDLGVMYFTSDGVVEDLKKSEELFTEACKGRVAKGCFYLGYLYKRGGNGIKKDKLKAKLAFGRACNIGSERSCMQFRKLEAKGI